MTWHAHPSSPLSSWGEQSHCRWSTPWAWCWTCPPLPLGSPPYLLLHTQHTQPCGAGQAARDKHNIPWNSLIQTHWVYYANVQYNSEMVFISCNWSFCVSCFRRIINRHWRRRQAVDKCPLIGQNLETIDTWMSHTVPNKKMLALTSCCLALYHCTSGRFSYADPGFKPWTSHYGLYVKCTVFACGTALHHWIRQYWLTELSAK